MGTVIGLAAAGGLLGVYALIRARGQRIANRYENGFVRHKCPVCGTGNLKLEERTYGFLGITSVRRMVRCDNCRSTLREVEPGAWRFAVDPAVNRELYHYYNAEIITDEELMTLPEPDSQPSDVRFRSPPPLSEKPYFLQDEYDYAWPEDEGEDDEGDSPYARPDVEDPSQYWE
jgi:hypothetical protein